MKVRKILTKVRTGQNRISGPNSNNDQGQDFPVLRSGQVRIGFLGQNPIMTKVRIFLTLVRGSGFEGQDALKVRIFLTLVRGTEFEGQDFSVLGQTSFLDRKRTRKVT